MKALLFIISLVFTFVLALDGQAAEITTAFPIGFSNYYGFGLGFSTAVDFSLDKRWQLGGALVSYWTEAGRGNEALFGPTYNFSDDLERSAFLGGGIGYANLPWFPDDRTFIGYVDFGKRFLLSEKHHITYKPSLQIIAGKGAVELVPSILSFSMIF